MNIFATELLNPLQVDFTISILEIEKFLTRIRERKIDLYPDYSRKKVSWNRQKQSSYIESILARVPLPSIYIDSRDDDYWQIIDGAEALRTLADFCLYESIQLRDLNYFPDFEGHVFSELPRFIQRRIEETCINVFLVNPGTPENVFSNLFNRIRS